MRFNVIYTNMISICTWLCTTVLSLSGSLLVINYEMQAIVWFKFPLMIYFILMRAFLICYFVLLYRSCIHTTYFLCYGKGFEGITTSILLCFNMSSMVFFFVLCIKKEKYLPQNSSQNIVFESAWSGLLEQAENVCSDWNQLSSC